MKIAPGRRPDVPQGEWRLETAGMLVPQREPLPAWVELMADRNVFFQDFTDDKCTITIPGTAEHVISVGAVAVTELLFCSRTRRGGRHGAAARSRKLSRRGSCCLGPAPIASTCGL